MVKKTVLITGASRGLGKELALIFGKGGWREIIQGRDSGALSDVAAHVTSNGVECDVVEGDLRNYQTILQLRDAARRRNLDVLINNAGIYLRKPFHETSVEEVRDIVDTNLVAPILLTREIYPFFLQRSSGLIVNVNSLAGLDACATESVYCASKHGLRGFSDAIKAEADKQGVLVLDIYPGAMRTEMTRDRPNYADLGNPAEVAELIYRECGEDRPSTRVDNIVIRRRGYRNSNVR